MATLTFVVKVVLSSVCMAAFIYWHSSVPWSQYSEIERIFELGKQISVAVIVFVLLIYVLGIRFKDFRNGKASQI
jgi:peptidoglycan biosynthesis protein MviN/MurJ (putative lipid II flippase)